MAPMLSAATAVWLGILTSVSPCPLATNIAAISFVGKRVGSVRHVLLGGLLYALGRAITYVALGVVLVAGATSVPAVSAFLQEYMNKLLGPLLIIVGMILTELIRVNISAPLAADKLQKQVEKSGVWGAGLLGVAFALAFCPVSAALFFGSLIPLAVKHRAGLVLPGLYGLGTALPVIVFAVLIAVSARAVGAAFKRLTSLERRARFITGVVFILIGIYYSLKYVFRVL